LASSAALVVTNGDVVEDGGVKGVEEGVEEAKSAFTYWGQGRWRKEGEKGRRRKKEEKGEERGERGRSFEGR
jgi:hypothetical protein